jgi:opacity protein-like surface antigen
MTRNISWKLAFILMLFPAVAFAQAPFSAGSGPVLTASVGYSYLSVPIPSATRIGLNGLGASITADFPSRFGAKLDLNYARAANVFGTGHHSDVLSYMIGPMFYPVSNKRMAVYVQVLAGGSRADGVIPNGAGGFDITYSEGLAWAIGAGVERSISSTLSIRTETDYMNTSTIDSSGAFRGQSDLRLTGSLVYRWDWHSEGRRGRRRF